jgi:PEP-CTERM motif
MKRSLKALTLVCAFASAWPAAAAQYLFDGDGDSATINFDGFVSNSSNLIPGLTSTLKLKLLAGAGTKNFLFEYELSNTSTQAFSGSRVSGFAFNSNPDVDGAIINLGDFTNIVHNGMNYPNNIGNVEICLNSANSCAGGGGGGATFMDPASGRFTLSFDNSPQDGIILDRFFVRYQSLPTREGSASGQVVTTAVPEPEAWMLMLVGFFGLGVALRRRSGGSANARTFA